MPETAFGRVAVMTSPRELDYAEYPLPAPEPGAILGDTGCRIRPASSAETS